METQALPIAAPSSESTLDEPGARGMRADIEALVNRFAEEAEQGTISEQTAQQLAQLLRRAHQQERSCLGPREYRSHSR